MNRTWTPEIESLLSDDAVRIVRETFPGLPGDRLEELASEAAVAFLEYLAKDMERATRPASVHRAILKTIIRRTGARLLPRGPETVDTAALDSEPVRRPAPIVTQNRSRKATDGRPRPTDADWQGFIPLLFGAAHLQFRVVPVWESKANEFRRLAVLAQRVTAAFEAQDLPTAADGAKELSATLHKARFAPQDETLQAFLRPPADAPGYPRGVGIFGVFSEAGVPFDLSPNGAFRISIANAGESRALAAALHDVAVQFDMLRTSLPGGRARSPFPGTKQQRGRPTRAWLQAAVEFAGRFAVGEREMAAKLVHFALMNLAAARISGNDDARRRREDILVACGINLGEPLDAWRRHFEASIKEAKRK